MSNETERKESPRKLIALLASSFLGYCGLNLLFVLQATLERGFDASVWISAITQFNAILVVILFYPLYFLLSSWIYLWAALLLLFHYKQETWSGTVRVLTNVIFIIIGLAPFLIALFIEGMDGFLFFWTIPLWFISFNYTFFTWRTARKHHKASQVNWFWIIWVIFLTLAFLVNPVMFRITLK
ncbi:MAG: hypothetical protein ACFFDT_17345 [Candidatus Hodarchaeota archaeon]